MGYQRKNLKLVWPDDSEFAGLEVTMRRMSIGRVISMTKLADVRFDREHLDEAGGAFDQIISALHKALLAWNLLDDEGGLVPTSREALDEQDVDLVMSIFGAWIDAASAVAPPLPRSSNSGGLSPAEFETLTALKSESLPSLPAPN